MSEPPTPIEAALLEAIEERLAGIEAQLQAQQGFLESFPARLLEEPTYICAQCNSKIMTRDYNLRSGLYYHVKHMR